MTPEQKVIARWKRTNTQVAAHQQRKGHKSQSSPQVFLSRAEINDLSTARQRLAAAFRGQIRSHPPQKPAAQKPAEQKPVAPNLHITSNNNQNTMSHNPSTDEFIGSLIRQRLTKAEQRDVDNFSFLKYIEGMSGRNGNKLDGIEKEMADEGKRESYGTKCDFPGMLSANVLS